MKSAAAGLALLALVGCDNMQHQANRRPLTPSPLFTDGTSAQHPPVHTIPADSPPEPPAPFPDTPLAELRRGQSLFEADCAPCHGRDGYGTGIIVRRGFPAPDSLHSARQRTLSDAQIGMAISQGKGAMYPLADQLSPNDRLRVVAYVRALQRSQHTSIADVPEIEKTQLNPP